MLRQDYEDPDYKLDGQGGSYREWTQPYCGKMSLERSERIMHFYHTRKYIDALKYPWLCFATKGAIYRGRVSN